MLDILDQIGARVIAVALDSDGPRPDALRSALGRQPVAFVYEPRNSSCAGATVSPERQRELATALKPYDTLVIEDDAWGPLRDEPYHGVGALLPHRTVLVRSYSKSHSPDLRLGVMGGPRNPIERAHLYRHFGDGWTSRILQNALAWMLQDPVSQRAVTHAREVYRARRNYFVSLLEERGLQALGGDNLALWVPVTDERHAMLALASYGIAVGENSANWTGPAPPGIRVATSLEIPQAERVADAIAAAAKAG